MCLLRVFEGPESSGDMMKGLCPSKGVATGRGKKTARTSWSRGLGGERKCQGRGFLRCCAQRVTRETYMSKQGGQRQTGHQGDGARGCRPCCTCEKSLQCVALGIESYNPAFGDKVVGLVTRSRSREMPCGEQHDVAAQHDGAQHEWLISGQGCFAPAGGGRISFLGSDFDKNARINARVHAHVRARAG